MKTRIYAAPAVKGLSGYFYFDLTLQMITASIFHNKLSRVNEVLYGYEMISKTMYWLTLIKWSQQNLNYILNYKAYFSFIWNF